jgi:hypothetical protein
MAGAPGEAQANGNVAAGLVGRAGQDLPAAALTDQHAVEAVRRAAGTGLMRPAAPVINPAPHDSSVKKVAGYVHLCRASSAYTGPMKDSPHLDSAARRERLLELILDLTKHPDFPLVRAALELVAQVNPHARTALRVTRVLEGTSDPRRAEQAAVRLRELLSRTDVLHRLRARGDDPLARDLLRVAQTLRREV